MLYKLKTYFANQARQPSGFFGRWIAPRVFNKENREMERLGLQMMQPQEDDHILEIGFGNGKLISEIMPDIRNGKIYGIDISDEMINLAADRNQKWIQQNKLELKKASVEEIPYPNNHFDKIFTANTTYFWPDPVKNILEIKRVLKPGGKFVCALRFKDQMESISVIRDNREIFQNLYKESEMRNLFEQTGFGDVQFRSESGDSDEFSIATGFKSNQN